MLLARRDHTSAAIRNKLYVFSWCSDGTRPEVFDIFSNRFQYITAPKSKIVFATSPVTIGGKILLFKIHSFEMIEYGTDTGEWSDVKKMSSEVELNRIHYFSSLKIPHF